MVKKRWPPGLYLLPTCCRRVSDHLTQSPGHLNTSSHSQLERTAAGTAGDSPTESAAAWEQAMDSPALEVLKTQLDKALNNTASSQLCCEHEVSWTRDLQRSLPTKSVCSLNKPYYSGKRKKTRGQSLREDVSLRAKHLVFLKWPYRAKILAAQGELSPWPC